jgi:Ca2+/H+ antiporter
MEQPMVSGQSRTSGMAIGGFICSFLCGLLGLILSIIALNQINKSMGMLRGKGLAMAGIIISILSMVGWGSMQACGRSSYRRSYRTYRFGQLEQKKHQQPVTARAVDQAQLQRLAEASSAVRL